MYSSVRESSTFIANDDTITTMVFTVYEHFSGAIYTHGRSNLIGVFKVKPLFKCQGKCNFEGVVIKNDSNFRIIIRKFDSEISSILRKYPWITTDMITYIAELFNQYMVTGTVINSNQNIHIHAPQVNFGGNGSAGFSGWFNRSHAGADGKCQINWISTGDSYAGIKTYRLGTPNEPKPTVKPVPWKIKVERCNNLTARSNVGAVVDSLKARIDTESSSTDSIDVVVGRIVWQTNMMCKDHGIDLEVFSYVNNEENEIVFVVAQRFKSTYNIFISRNHLLSNSVLDIVKEAKDVCRGCRHRSKCVTVTK